MQKRSIIILLIMLMLAPVFTLTCSRDDTAIVRIQLKNVPQSTAHTANSIFERVFRWFVREAWAMSSWVTIPESLKVIITAPDLEDISFEIPPSETSLTLELPSGSARKIAVYGYTTVSSFGKNWGGYAELNLNPGDDVDVQIDMLPVMKIDSTNSYQLSTYIQLQWFQVQSGTYGIIGYNIYRSDFPEGPYFAVGSASGVSAYRFNDNSITFAENTYYYYKVSAYTDTTEGEFSEYCAVLYLS